MRRFLLLLWLFALHACSPQGDPPLFEAKSPAETGVDFRNDLQPNDSLNVLDYEYFYNGAGVAVGDINNDGREDLFFAGNQRPGQLYLNEGNWRFRAIPLDTAAYWAVGAVFADVNADGWLDLYVCAAGYAQAAKRRNRLYINKKNNTFREEAGVRGLASDTYTTQAAFFDYDADNDLDCYLLTHGNKDRDPTAIAPVRRDGSAPSTDKLLRNDGTGHFTDVSAQAGIREEGYGLGLVITDVNSDGRPDIFVSNDYIYNDLLYLNQGDGTFRESAAAWFRHTSLFSMGTDAADLNNDGLPDLVTVDMMPPGNARQKLLSGPLQHQRYELSLRQGYIPQFMRNMLQINTGMGHFSETGLLAGMAETDWSWAPLLADFDLDGHRDLFISNGYAKNITDRDFAVYSAQHRSGRLADGPFRDSLKQGVGRLAGAPLVNYLFQNKGDGRFADRSKSWGFAQPTLSNGAAYADLDNDGDLDLVVNNLQGVAGLWENRARQQHPERHFLSLNLIGAAGNLFAEGAAVVLIKDGNMISRAEKSSTRGYASSVTQTLHVGLGETAGPLTVEVRWPDGRTQRWPDVMTDQTLTLYEDTLAAETPVFAVKNPAIGADITAKSGIQWTHQEDPFRDYNLQPLTPRGFSRQGPPLAVGDVNGDDLDDFYVGGSAGMPRALWIQTADGRFAEVPFPAENVFEDAAALFFDADGDADVDIYIVSGGWQHFPGTDFYQDRLYRNDGQGHFTRDHDALPAIFSSGSCLAAADFDRDGDLDLFRGGSAYPGRYPLPDQSFLLRNEGGRFIQITDQICPDLRRVGILNAAAWADTDRDGYPELLLAGDFMPLTIFKNEQGRRLTPDLQRNLTSARGWWSAIQPLDADGDGDLDFMAGNLGLNNPWYASPEKPLRVFAKDFDKNGSLDAILARSCGDKLYPFASRDALSEQLPFLKKKFTTYKAFSTADLNAVLKARDQSESYQLEAGYFASVYAENDGRGRFTLHSLPLAAQIAPISRIAVLNPINIGKTRIFMAGNCLDNEPTYGPNDAGDGLWLEQQPDHQWKIIGKTPLTGSTSGAQFLRRGSAPAALLVARTNEALSLLEMYLF